MADLWPGMSAGAPNPNYNPNTAFLPPAGQTTPNSYVTYNGGQGGQGGTPIYGISTTIPNTGGGSTTTPLTPGQANPYTASSVMNTATGQATNLAPAPTTNPITPTLPVDQAKSILPVVPTKPLEAQPTLPDETWNQINQSPIPQIPGDYGQGSGLDQVNWALQQRKSIYDTYKKYGITPSMEEVNWQLSHNPDINSIDQSIMSAVKSGADTRGKMPATVNPNTAQTPPGLPTVPHQNPLEADVAKNLGLSPEEVKDQEAIDAKTANLKSFDTSVTGVNNAIAEQPIAQGFVTGQQTAVNRASALTRQGITNDIQTLQQQLATAQAKRIAALDASKFALERQDTKDAQARQDAKDAQARADKLAQKDVKFETFNGQDWQLTYDSNGNLIDKTALGSTKTSGSGGGGTAKLTDSSGEPIVNPELANSKLTTQEETTAYNNIMRATAILSGKVNSGEYTIDQAVDEIYYQKIKGSVTYGNYYSKEYIRQSIMG